MNDIALITGAWSRSAAMRRDWRTGSQPCASPPTRAPPEGAELALASAREALGEAPARLAHCVGSTLIAPLHRTKHDADREPMRVNLDSAVRMLQGGAGAAVFASSVVARIGVANHEAIAVAKGGVEALVQ